MEFTNNDLQTLVNLVAWLFAGLSVAFVVYLIWRKFGPGHRHRRRHSRMRRYIGKS